MTIQSVFELQRSDFGATLVAGISKFKGELFEARTWRRLSGGWWSWPQVAKKYGQ